MQQLQDLIPYQYLIVAAVVLAALFVVTVVFRMLAGRSSFAESSRLGVSEYLEIDKQRRLVLLRRDDVEHLVLIGGGQDIVVEAVIRPGVQRRDDSPAPRVIAGDRPDGDGERASRADAMVRPLPLRPARPPVFGDEAPPPAERPEPRLEPLKGEDKSREA